MIRNLRAKTIAMALAALAASAPAVAHAEEPAAAAGPTWRDRFEAARARMIEGDHVRAEADFRALAETAPSDTDRALAYEMARLAASYVAEARTKTLPPPQPRVSRLRTGDEMTLLYATSFLYGAGTGAWFLLQVQPDSALTATLPFAALTAAPVVAVATLDAYKPFRRGVPHAISAGLYLGLGQGIWLLGFQHARSMRLEREDARSDARWTPETSATVLWGGATLGATLGYALGSTLVTTPGRVSFTTSTSVWAAAITGLTTGALLPDDDLRRERAFGAAGIGYNAGLVSGLLFAGDVSPSVARVRLVDLVGVAGGLVSSGLYLSLASNADVRTAEGLAALGAGVGLATGWIVTSGMQKELPPKDGAVRTTTTVSPAVTPVRGGATLGLAGTL